MKMRLMAMTLAWLGGSVTTAGMLMTTHVLADGDPYTDSVPRLVPYEGTLEKDGVGYEGDIEMTFSIYDGANATTASWTETQTVNVYGGRFNVLLGNKSTASVTALETVLQAADDIYLGVGLKTDDGDVALQSRKRFVPVPYAMWAAAGTDLTVGHRLVIESDLSASSSDGPLLIRNDSGATLAIDGDSIESSSTLGINTTSKQAVSIGGALTVNGNDVSIINTANGDGGVALRHSSGDTLVINPGSGYSGGTRIEGNLTVGVVSGLDVTITLDTDGGDCYTEDLGLHSSAYNWTCNDGYALVGGNWQGLVNNGKALQFARCCPIKVTVQ